MVQLVHGKNLGIGKAAEERHRSGAEKAGKQSEHLIPIRNKNPSNSALAEQVLLALFPHAFSVEHVP